MQGYQSVTVAGNIGRDPEIRYTDTGDAVCNFSVAVNEKWKDGEHTEWFRVSCWGNTAEACAKYLSKGSPVLVSGTLRTREYEGKDGEKKRSTELRALRVVFLGSTDSAPEEKPAPRAGADDIPF